MSATLDTSPQVAQLPELLVPMRERLLANLVMIAQIPSPTGREGERARFLLDRFQESGLSDAAFDEVGNAVGRLQGRGGGRTILLMSHLDDVYQPSLDRTVTVQADRVLGPGVADNALGAAVVSMVPAVLRHLGVELHSDLILLGSTRSLGHGDHGGARFFLDHAPQRIDLGICVEGVQLGRLNYFSIGAARGDIHCDSHASVASSYGHTSALVVLNQIVHRILEIALPSHPATVIRLGKMHSGVSYDVEPDHAELGLEIVSHADEMVEQIVGQIHNIVAEMSARHGVKSRLDVFSRVGGGGVPFAHPLVKGTMAVMQQLGIEPDQGHSPSELAELVARGIPGITLGITRGEKNLLLDPDYVLIDPILTGVAQLIAVLLRIDEGACDEARP